MQYKLNNKTPNWFKLLFFILLLLATKQFTTCGGVILKSIHFHLWNVLQCNQVPWLLSRIQLIKGISSWVL